MNDASVCVAALASFAYTEARLIDEKRFDEWYDLFADDGIYWIPLTREQPDGINYTSLLYEDKLLLKIRIERLKNPRSFSQQPPSFCQHILQQPVIESAGPGMEEWVVRAPFLYIESQLDAQVVLAGVSHLHLVRSSEQLRIRLKRVELVNREAALASIQLFP